MVSTCMQGAVQKRFSSPASTAVSPGRMQSGRQSVCNEVQQPREHRGFPGA